MKQHRNELILILVLLIAALLLLGWQSFRRISGEGQALQAVVSVGGEEVETIDLSQDGEYTIQGAGGGSNHLVVENGRIWCDQATCPDKVCIQQGEQSLEGGTIVCLPNRMIVQITRP